MDTSSLVLGLRVLLSLAVVLGLLWYLGRRMSGSASVRRRRAQTVTVLGKQTLGGKSSVALIEISGRRLLLGVGEQGVTLLTELEVEPEPEPTPRRGPEERDELDAAALEGLIADVPADLSSLDALTSVATRPARTARPAGRTLTRTSHPSLSTPAARMPAVPTPRNPLEGSILDATVWRRAVVAVQERTLRR